MAPATQTDSVLLTNLPKDSFTPNFIAFLRTAVAKYGPVRRFTPLKSFGRCIVTYARLDDARKAREQLEDDLEASHVSGVRVFYAEHVRIEDDDAEKYLQVPHLERNFLLSPPGSPPIGWVQGFEQAPNANPELFSTLAELEADQFTLNPEGLGDVDSTSEGTASASPTHTDIPILAAQLRLTITPRAPGEDPMLDSPVAIVVQDWGSADHRILSGEELLAQERGNVAFRHQIETDMQSWAQAQAPAANFGGVSARRAARHGLPRTAMPPVTRSVE